MGSRASRRTGCLVFRTGRAVHPETEAQEGSVMDNTALWDKLGKTDPSHTKTFKRSGGFSGTAIKPMWSYRRMTEEFGPCGVGWGVNRPEFQVVPAGEEILVFCTVSVWYICDAITETKFKDTISEVYGVGGDKVSAKFTSGLRSDDEAFKKAFTDAVTNALKLIGVGADVHMGMFDDNKYVNTVAKEFEEEASVKAKSSAQLKREGEWERVSKEIAEAMNDVRTFGKFESLKDSYRREAKKNGWNETFMFQLRDLFVSYEADVQKRVDEDNEAEGAVEHEKAYIETFGGRVVNERHLSTLEAGE
jgi:hypothetical protein